MVTFGSNFNYLHYLEYKRVASLSNETNYQMILFFFFFFNQILLMQSNYIKSQSDILLFLLFFFISESYQHIYKTKFLNTFTWSL